jgi:hypothetical protein
MQRGGTRPLVRSLAGSHARFHLEWVPVQGRCKYTRASEREREKEGEGAQKGRRRRRFGIYADRCPTVNRPIRRPHVRIAGQSRPLFFRRASLDRRLVFRILYYTVLPGPVSRLPPPPPPPSSARRGPRRAHVPVPVGEALRVKSCSRGRRRGGRG